MVALEADEVLVAGVGGVQLLRVRDGDEGVLGGVRKEGGDEAAGHDVEGRDLRRRGTSGTQDCAALGT